MWIEERQKEDGNETKLQDLVGTKIFREFLNEMGFITEGESFLEILKEIEKEGTPYLIEVVKKIESKTRK